MPLGQLIFATHSSESSHARAGGENSVKVNADAAEFVGEIRTGTYQAHFASGNVEQLQDEGLNVHIKSCWKLTLSVA